MDNVKIEQSKKVQASELASGTQSKLFNDAYIEDRSKASEGMTAAALIASKNDTPAPDSGSKYSPLRSPGLVNELILYGKEVCHEGKQIVQEHPWLIGALGTAAIIVASKGRLAKFLGAEKELSEASRMIERDSVRTQVGVIPDVLRPQIDSSAPFNAVFEFEKVSSAYRSSLSSLQQLPTHYSSGEAMNLDASFPDIAKRVLEDRSPITGEFVNPESIDKEVQRIRGLNPNLAHNDRPQDLLVHNGPAISKLGEITRFKFVPQIGQILKQYGVSEENIQEGFRIQNAMPKEKRPLIGQILVDAKLATKSQVDDAFAQQNTLKSMLKQIQSELFGE